MMIKRLFPIPNHLREQLPTLAEDKKQVLQQQTITQDSPRTILRDFQNILEFLQPDGVEVSSTYHQFSLKYLQQLNSRLSYPIEFSHPFVDIPPNTNDFRLGELPLKTGNHLQFIFDLRDEWEFDLQLEKIEPANAKMKKPKILEFHGEAPIQYGEEEELY